MATVECGVTVATTGCGICAVVVFGCAAIVSALVGVTAVVARSVVRSLESAAVMKAVVGIETVEVVVTVSALAVVDGATLDLVEGGDVIGVALVGCTVVLDSVLLVTVETAENQVTLRTLECLCIYQQNITIKEMHFKIIHLKK